MTLPLYFWGIFALSRIRDRITVRTPDRFRAGGGLGAAFMGSQGEKSGGNGCDILFLRLLWN